MAKVAGNMVLVGVSGMIGNQLVIRQADGRIIMSQAPVPSTKPPSELQAEGRLNFQSGVIYAKGVYSDPAKKALYEAKVKPGTSAFNVAVADFLKAPNIDEIDLGNYNGTAADTIRVRVTDDFQVVKVTVTIHNADGTLVEEGEAVQQENVIDWLYTVTADNPSLEGDRIEIRAWDRPEHVTEEEKTI